MSEARTRSVNVTGPSLVRETCMWAPNRPVSTSECSARARRTTCSNSRSPSSGGAAPERLGRAPLRVSAGERELGHEQEPGADVGDAEIHLAVIIGKHAVPDQTFHEAVACPLGVSALHANQDHQTGADGADGVRPDVDPCAGDALEQPDHGVPGVGVTAASAASRGRRFRVSRFQGTLGQVKCATCGSDLGHGHAA